MPKPSKSVSRFCRLCGKSYDALKGHDCKPAPRAACPEASTPKTTTLPIAASAKSADAKPKDGPPDGSLVAPNIGRSLPPNIVLETPKREPPRAKDSPLVFTRNRAAYNAYQRDYKKASNMGLTVAEYRAKQKGQQT